MGANDDHYLAVELTRLIQEDPAIFRFLEAGSLDGVWYWDLTDMDHEWMSDRFWETFGYEPSTKPPLASAWQDMIDPDDRALATTNVQAHLADPNHPYDQVVRYRHADGHTVWVRCRGIAIRDEDGRPIRMLGAHQDITELKRAEAKLVRTNQQLERVNDDLRRFAYAASHDIRSPAVTLRTLLDRLADHHAHHLDDEGRQVLAFAQESARRMMEMSDRVLDYARVTRQTLEPAAVNLHELTVLVRDELAASITRSGAEVLVDADVHVVVDPAMMRIALRNLLENALSYRGEASPVVHVTAESIDGGRHVRLSVDDNGVGVPPERRESVLTAFQRLHLRSELAGIGLGLPMVVHVAQAHGGMVQVQDSPLGGARFVMTFDTRPLEGVWRDDG